MRILAVFFVFTFSLAVAADLKFLTRGENEWLDSLRRDIRVGVTRIPNQVLRTEDGGLEGFSIDLFSLIEKKSGMHFHYVYFDSWEELIDAAKNGRIDVVFLAQKTASRLRYFYFTDTVLTLQNKLIVNTENRFDSLAALKNRRVAVTAGSALEEHMRDYHPDIVVVPTKNELESLKLVVDGRVEATVLELVRASYYMRRYNLNSLVISSDVDYGYHLSIASVKRLPELNIILSKTLAAIGKRETEALKLKWGYIKEKKLFFDRQTMIYLAIAFGIIIPFSFYLFVINRRLKAEMREKEKAMARVVKLRDSKLNEMTKMISMIAHQWKQPLNSLSILIQSLKIKQKKGMLDDASIEYFYEKSTRQIDLMAKTVDDFRDLFKISEKRETFDLGAMMDELTVTLQPELSRHGIRVNLHAGNGDFLVHSYRSMLFQIVMNIVNNAKDALAESAEEDKRIEITLARTEEGRVISVRDNGGGIPEEIIDRIFDPYFSTKRKKNGTGLGLYMSKLILEEKMKGVIRVENVGGGALFSIVIP